MKLQSKNKVSADFSMASMTDIVFLLLIFFMLTSNVAQSAIDLKLPKSNTSKSSQEPVAVSISNEGLFYIGEVNIEKENLEFALKNTFAGEPNPSFIIRAANQSVVQELVYVMSIANRNKYKIVLAIAPQK